MYKASVPGARNEDQKVDAFSAPKDLLRAAGVEALKRGMTKSGFYRYCLAKECGYSEAEAVIYAEHGSVMRSRESLERSVAKRDKPDFDPIKKAELTGVALLGAQVAVAALGRKPKAASPSGSSALQRSPARPGKGVRPKPQAQVP